MQKTHKIRLNPTPEQKEDFMRAAGIARFAWNWALTEYKRRKEAGKAVDWNAIKKEFRARIDAEFPFVREATKCAAEEGIADLRRAISTYNKSKPKNPGVRFPQLRKRSKRIGGFGIANDKFRVEGHEARLPKIGAVNMAEPLRFEGRIVRGRVTEQGGRWYLTVGVDVAAGEQSPPQRAVGIDFGLHRFATLSNGEVVETQARLRRSAEKLKRLQRGLARKRRGSRNRKKWKRKVTRFHERVRHQRQDFLHKFTSAVTGRFGVVCVEDLNLKGLCRTRLAKPFHDAGIGKATAQLEYKQAWSGGVLQKVGRFFPSSKRCHVCFSVNAELELSDREWRCTVCGTLHDRDRNAAINIETEGLALLAGDGYLGVTPVEPTASTMGFDPRQAVAVKQVLDGAHSCAPER
jgi:putative transposase